MKYLQAKTIFSLYCQHGLDQYDDWLSMKKNRIDRLTVLDSLRVPAIRERAEIYLKSRERRVAELRELLAESTTHGSEGRE